MRTHCRGEPASLIDLSSGGPGAHRFDVHIADDRGDVADGHGADRSTRLNPVHTARRARAVTGDDGVDVATARVRRE